VSCGLELRRFASSLAAFLGDKCLVAAIFHMKALLVMIIKVHVNYDA